MARSRVHDERHPCGDSHTVGYRPEDFGPRTDLPTVAQDPTDRAGMEEGSGITRLVGSRPSGLGLDAIAPAETCEKPPQWGTTAPQGGADRCIRADRCISAWSRHACRGRVRYLNAGGVCRGWLAPLPVWLASQLHGTASAHSPLGCPWALALVCVADSDYRSGVHRPVRGED